ncbi:hypothetical protein [Streptomyces silvisoli]|uniref:hypothetical protein n=1 Tax=Streptomyces silvisoli TaxID=3034235 RepID=UPI0028BD5999|nr:hypothetical protein [Streptomyces silvisoli]
MTAVVHREGPIGGDWQTGTPNLKEPVLAYLRSAEAPTLLTWSARVADPSGARVVAA